MLRRLLIAGNWKMNGLSTEAATLVTDVCEAVAEVKGMESVDLLVCPAYPYLASVATQLGENGPVALGAQDCSTKEAGAYTGQVSAKMLVDVGCKYVIVGHSERRSYWSESSNLVKDKFLAAQQQGPKPILCVGETREQREAGETARVVLDQLDAVLKVVGIEAFSQAVIAYEPVWAIGTGLNAAPEQAQVVHAMIRSRLSEASVEIADEVTVLYGGSVKADNALGLFRHNLSPPFHHHLLPSLESPVQCQTGVTRHGPYPTASISPYRQLA